MDTSTLVLRLEAGVWLAVGVVGVLVFLLGVYIPAFKGIPYAADLQIVVAAGGGALAVFGLSLYFDRRRYDRAHPASARPLRGRARELAIAPSFEVYSPAAPPVEPAAGPREPDETR